jgi:ADP-ribose pyrophosphatase YjhB (NUDIX family)
MNRAWKFFQTVLGVIFRHPVTGATIIPILSDDRIVLVRRRDNGRWSLPGGIVNWGEDIPATVQRELAEETGLELVSIRRLVGVYSAPNRDPRMHSIAVLVAADVSGEMQVRDRTEIVEVQAFPLNDLPTGKLAHDHDRHLRDYFDGVTRLD